MSRHIRVECCGAQMESVRRIAWGGRSKTEVGEIFECSICGAQAEAVLKTIGSVRMPEQAPRT